MVGSLNAMTLRSKGQP